ncbi:protein LiaH [Insulibacter thermoxylanivorax]|uniref:Protein LiaH n=1 Tax=Insulibacter thermoxylanivorax TaxID=2749268 RepID=A0A916QFL9_9BACL|nr:PspA/IM30 family protein [Insulibacter thermoxylanivorax]GFR38034.1 protein LiaH [Insulibacter thermoxylanivorax]
MSVMKRIRDITVANLNDRLERAEDPVKLIDEFLTARREQIMQTEQLYNQCARHMEAMREQYLQAGLLAEKREQQASVALKAGEEEIARLALQDKLLNEEKAQQYKGLYEQAKSNVAELTQELATLRTEYEEVLSKRQYYAARMESIRLRQRMNERMHQAGWRSTESAFRRLEDRVSDLEMETMTLRELRRMTEETIYQAGSVLKSTLEQELQKLKERLEKEGAGK